ncbi:MAG: hypothetical protein M0006_15205 [Magnetospirillum sp.]|nr:hypothetical protein [Magnetospirillum sp.]
MPQARDLPTDLEWFRALEFSPDDLDEDEDERKSPDDIPSAPPVTAAVPPPPEKRGR